MYFSKVRMTKKVSKNGVREPPPDGRVAESTEGRESPCQSNPGAGEELKLRRAKMTQNGVRFAPNKQGHNGAYTTNPDLPAVAVSSVAAAAKGDAAKAGQSQSK